MALPFSTPPTNTQFGNFWVSRGVCDYFANPTNAAAGRCVLCMCHSLLHDRHVCTAGCGSDLSGRTFKGSENCRHTGI